MRFLKELEPSMLLTANRLEWLRGAEANQTGLALRRGHSSLQP